MFRFLRNPKTIPYHLSSSRFSHSHPSPTKQTPQVKVGIFWDLKNKPPNAVAPYEATIKLKKAISSFGVIKYMIAYVPPRVRDQTKVKEATNGLQNKCPVCRRRFYNNEKMVNHFKIHEREHEKRLNQIDSAKGRKRLGLVCKYSAKMDKYERAEVGYGLADDLKRAGFRVAGDSALRAHMVDVMDHRRVECLVLVSDYSDFLGLLREARERCFRMVVVGDRDDGVLKRNADAWFSWKEILVGKARKEGSAVVGRWRDCNVLKRLEWIYKPEMGKDVGDESDEDDDLGELSCVTDEDNDLGRSSESGC